MALELRLIERDVLDGHCFFTGHMLQDTIHKREAIAVGEQSHDLLRGEQRLGCGGSGGGSQIVSALSIGSIGQNRCQVGMQTMGAAVDQHLRPRKTHKGQITDQVQKLMAHRFIGIAQRWI